MVYVDFTDILLDGQSASSYSDDLESDLLLLLEGCRIPTQIARVRDVA